jgi:serine protease AprX
MKTSTCSCLRSIFFIWTFSVLSQLVFSDSYYFYVQFSDKNNTPFSINNPEGFLTERAITRRADQWIVCDSTDLPVNPSYVTQVANLGINIHSRSKWMNGITVLVEDSTLMSQVRGLPFVNFVQYTGKKFTVLPTSAAKSKFLKESLNYGAAASQITQLNGEVLHEHGSTGSNILIGVLDAGFKNVNINPAFDSLRMQNRLVGATSIIDPSVNIYNEDDHGANVLSIMTGNLPGQYLGVAPHASFWLIQTEYVPTEYLVETDFWVRGIEFADSVGVDVINSSLGYTEFDDATMNFTYADMNGTVSRASRAARMASQKGIVVCASAGNDGAKPWKYIGSPADADGILTVGAVNSAGTISSFSSFGPTFDNRIKPEVCATGSATAIVNPSGNIVYGNGTSFSSPVIAGITACYMQFYKSQSAYGYTVNNIRQNIISSGHLYTNPDNQLGYGIPDFQAVIYNTPTNSTFEYKQNDLFKSYYNKLLKQICIVKSPFAANEDFYLEIYATSGLLVHRELLSRTNNYIDVAHFSKGIYITRLSSDTKSQLTKIIIP